MNTPSSALSDEMKGAMSTLLNAVIFEQWLRFSWIEEDEEGDFCIQIPAETVSELVEDYPEYEGLIAQLNGTIVDADHGLFRRPRLCAILAWGTEPRRAGAQRIPEYGGAFPPVAQRQRGSAGSGPEEFRSVVRAVPRRLAAGQGRQRVRLCRASAPTGSAHGNGVPLKRYSFQRSPRLSSGRSVPF